VLIAGVEGFATIIRNTGALDCQNFTFSEIELSGILAPKCKLNLKASLISELEGALIFGWADASIVALWLER
jgi:hypothetical protein